MKKKALALLFMAAMLMQLVACGSGSTSSQAPAGSSTGAASSVNSAEPITLRIVDWSDSTKARREVYNQKFMDENPNVTVEYTVLTADQFKESVISSIKGGDAPDLFPVPSGMKLSAVVAENWYQPMTPYVTEEFINSFAPGALNEGITTLDGELYVVPEAANIINTLIFYNKTILADAGIDKLPETWSEFAEVTKKVTEAGKGKYYGIIDSGAQTNRLELFLRSLASLEGARTGDISQMIMVDGKNVMGSDGVMKAFEFYDSLVKSGVFHPDSVTLKAPEARALFAQNQAAFICQGSWCISTWRKDNPDLDFGVMAVPLPDDGAKGKLPYVGAQPWMGISANSKNPEMAAKYLMGLYSEEYQSGLVEDGGFVSVIDSVNEKAMTDEVMLEYYKLHNSTAALAPDPIVGNPDTALVYAEVTAISPNMGEIVQGVLSQSVNYADELKTLATKTQDEWDRAIKAAADNGANVTAADFEFPNWDPMKNYTAEMYALR